jgi:WD40 repeat protein
MLQQLLNEHNRRGREPMTFSPGGDWLAAGKTSGFVLWDLGLVAESSPADGVPLPGTTSGQDFGMAFALGTISAIAFNPDGQTLATGDLQAGIILHETRSGAQILELESSHRGAIAGLAFNLEGDTLFSIGVDGQIILWDVAANSPTFGQPYGPPIVGPQLRNFPPISFSLDNRRLAAGKRDGSIILWNLDFDSWRSLACWRAGRNLTQEEWRQFFGEEPYHQTCPELPAGRLVQE